MRRRYVQAIAVLLAGILYWQLVCLWSGTKEPWDAQGYWSMAYPLSLALSAAAGLLLRTGAWSAGAMLILAQLPVVAVNGGAGPLFAAGLVYACILAIPAMAIAELAGRLAARIRRG